MYFDYIFANERIATKFKKNFEMRKSIRKNTIKKLFDTFITRIKKQIS